MKIKDLSSNLRAKVFDACKDGERQIGDVNFTEEERAQLKEFYMSLTNCPPNSGQKWGPEESELAAAFLISAIKNYKDDWTGKEFWDRITPQIGRRPDYKTELQAIAAALTRYNRPFFISGGGIHKYVESFFYQAYSPQISVRSFIRLAWSLYTNSEVFDLTYFDTDSDGRLCEAIIRSLDSHYKNVDFDQDFTFESTTYSIRAGLRYAFSQDQKGVTKMLRRILKYIDFIYQHRTKVDEDNEGYLGKLCNEAVPKLIASYTESSRRMRTPRARETIDDIEKIKATYLFQDDQLHLYFPKIRLYKEDQQFEKATVRLYINFDGTEMLVSKKIYGCVGEDYKHILREIYFPIQDFLPACGDGLNFRVTLSFDNNPPIYDSKQSLFRNFIVFKDGIETKTRLLVSADYRVVIPSTFVIKDNLHTKVDPIIRTENIIDFSPKDGDRISFNGTYVFFGQKESGAHFFFDEEESEPITGIVFVGNSATPYRVFEKVGNFIIRTDDRIRPEHLDVQLYKDGGELICHYPLSSLPSDGGIYSISLLKDIEKAAEDGARLLIVAVKDQSQDRFYFDDHFAVFTNLKIDRKGSPYLQKDSQTVLSIEGREYLATNPENATSVSIATDFGTAEVTTSYLNWRINQNEPHWLPSDENLPLLPDDFQSNDILYVDSFYDEIKLMCGEQEVPGNGKRGQYLLGMFFNTQRGHKAFLDRDEIWAAITVQGQPIKFPMFGLIAEQYLVDEDADSIITEEDGVLTISFVNNLRGDVDSMFKVVLEAQNHPEQKPVIQIGQFAKEPAIISGLVPDIYSIDVACQKSTDKSDYWPQIWCEEIEIGDLNSIRFHGVKRITINKLSHAKMKNLYITNISYAGDDGFGPTYHCLIHIEGNRGERGAFVVSGGTNFASSNIPIIGLYFEVNGEYREYSFDSQKKNICKEPIDGVRYRECLSVYARTE